MKITICTSSKKNNDMNVLLAIDGTIMAASTVTQTRDSIHMTFGECFEQFKKLYDNYNSTEKPLEFSESIFVEKDLYNILHTANKNVIGCVLVSDGDNKYVKIQMNNGASYGINVTGDSPLAMAKDVINFMMYR